MTERSIRGRGPYPYSRERRIHELCRSMRVAYARRHEEFDAACNQCPASQDIGGGMQGKLGCRLCAEEAYNIARHGNPWGWWPRVWWSQTLYKLQRRYRWIPRRRYERR